MLQCLHCRHPAAISISPFLAAAGILVAALALGCRNTTRSDIRFAPPALGDGIPVSSALAQEFDSARLSEVYQRAQRRPFRTAHSLLVARNGRLMAEGYSNGADSVSRSDVQSVTKSVTALLTGMAIADGQFVACGNRSWTSSQCASGAKQTLVGGR